MSNRFDVRTGRVEMPPDAQDRIEAVLANHFGAWTPAYDLANKIMHALLREEPT